MCKGLSVEHVNVAFGHRMWWVDAFVGGNERGNPAVVVLLERPLPDEDLQQIAFELGVSETGFLLSVGGTWTLRWFTPSVEVDLCGHATLAAAHVLTHELHAGSEHLFHTRSGVLSSRRLDHGLIGIDLPRLDISSVNTSYVGSAFGDVREVVVAGGHVIVELDSYDALCSVTPDPVALFLVPATLIIAVCEGGPNVDAAVRVFAPRLGLAEDPVTGSAMCAVAPWWMARTGSPTVTVRQASPRGGIMHARLFESNVEIAGHARTFLAGELRP